MGHSDIAVTVNNYAHILPAAQRQTADTIGRVLFDEAAPAGG